ncbi:hypothetical protein, partial [Bradyrhizobium sp. STM 3809]|uniref:hypothetical protein n=1 Tax=Bradyrhizobium sp. STM 3809 TaxID=551936 RepID=UPI001AEBF7F8
RVMRGVLLRHLHRPDLPDGHSSMPSRNGFDTKTAMRAKTKSRCAISGMTPVQSDRQKHSSFA